MRRDRESLLSWKTSKYYILVCVYVRARSRAFMRLPGRMGVWMRVRACNLAYPTCNSYAPYCDVICGFSGSTIFFDIIS